MIEYSHLSSASLLQESFKLMDQSKETIKPGVCVLCRILSPETGGYLATLTTWGIDGFMPSNEPIEIGRVVPATFVCMDGERALLTYAFVMGTSSRVQHSTASDEENAFAIWAEAYPNANRLSRAVDLIMPPIFSTPILLKLSENSAKEVFSSLEAAEFTGCIKVFCQNRLSRAAVIFRQGRAVGSVYTTKRISENYPFEVGLIKMMEDVSSPDADAELEMYELPSEIVLSMSALFLGYVDHRDEEIDNWSYAEKMMVHFLASKGTACLSLMQETKAPSALGFICNGEFQGTYSITERLFSDEKDFLRKLLERTPNTKLLAYILPAAMTTDSVRFGYSLSSGRFAGKE